MDNYNLAEPITNLQIKVYVDPQITVCFDPLQKADVLTLVSGYLVDRTCAG